MPNPYTWEIFWEREALPVEESFNRFASWEEASQAEKKVLKKLLANEFSIREPHPEHFSGKLRVVIGK